MPPEQQQQQNHEPTDGHHEPTPTPAPAPAPTSTTSRSPSPAAPPPLPTAPGPRATALQAVFGNALDATLKRVSHANFAACFPTPARYVPENLDAFWRDFVGKLGGAARTNFDQILKERNVVPALNELDALVAAAKKRKEQATAAAAAASASTSTGGPVSPPTPTPPHTLPPPTLLQAHLLPFLSSHTDRLDAQLATLHAENKALVSDIAAQRAEMDALLRGLEAVVGDLEGGVEMLAREEVQALTGEVLAIDGELGA
ncbi:uncharacterized protein K452DRAFT_316166 [Aplosporella prunicola CBS 121167]|uniref:MIND kinetochore complex component Nnf1 n=1 Tax=Aplosporella prunicola CBS 121167 TaxID=1176127 RepID=A0A6A6BQF7_9PEZI|nr:uncharacterized protein K452DRAFT_316166 [Aplosporella prunicola CBS 121167]KAF2145037.1 hypothetical protein K452DRAFT_316166 [Aplosporella prunicola CBS 121167]